MPRFFRMPEPLLTIRMLAEALKLPQTALRLWQRRGILQPTKIVGRLAYFGPRQFGNAKILARLYHAGLRSGKIADMIEALRRFFPETEASIYELPVEIRGRNILFRRDGILYDVQRQRLFDFPEPSDDEVFVETMRFEAEEMLAVLDTALIPPGREVEQLCEAAWELEEEGRLAEALELYRAALLAEGPEASLCFQVAELLYRQGDLTAARERYYMAIELDENYVEARANLGCILAELGDTDFAIRTFDGVLRFHPDYADVHFHLAKVLEKIGAHDEAAYHRQLYDALMPESPFGG